MTISKLTLCVKREYTGADLKQELLTKHNIQINKHSENTVLLMVNAGATMGSMSTLKNVLIGLAKKIEKSVKRSLVSTSTPKKELKIPSFSKFQDLDVNDQKSGIKNDIAFFFNNQGNWKIEWIAIGKDLIGRVSTTFVSPYPPGYPILVPGQIINEETINFLENLSTKEIHGTYIESDGNRRLSVFKIE